MSAEDEGPDVVTCPGCGIGFDNNPEQIRDELCHKCGRVEAEARVNALETQPLVKNGDRLLDLVRHQRSELHEAGLITDEEYVELCNVGSESARRLEEYDAVRAELTSLKTKLDRCDLDDFRHQRALIIAAKLASGDLAERVALDLDHDDRHHGAWYRAVKRLRREIGRFEGSPGVPWTNAERAAKPGRTP